MPSAPGQPSRLGEAVRRMGRAVPAGLFAALIGVWLAAHLLSGLQEALVYNGGIGDGPLQIFNPMRRIAAGQRGGADFQFFHGLAVPYLHYPLFAAAGKTIFASELSRQWVTTFAVLGGYLAVFAGVTRRFIPTLGLTAAALTLGSYLPAGGVESPRNSLIGLRSIAPLLAMGVVLAGFRPNREAIAVGVVAAAGVLIGTEHGAATALMLAVIWGGRRLIGHAGGSIGWAVRAAAAFAATLAGLLLLIGGPTGAAAPLRYAFRDLPADQFWYFGVPPNPFVSVPSQLLDRTLWLWGIGPVLVVGSAIARVVWVHPPARAGGIVLLAGLGAAALGGVGYLGYSSSHYLVPAARLALVAALAGGWYASRWAAADPSLYRVAGPPARAAIAVLTVVLLVVGPGGGWGIAALPQLARECRDAARAFARGDAVLSPVVLARDAPLIALIDADRAAAGATRPPVFWSTYAGLLEDHYGVLHPGTDYIIHAIGPTGRADYLERFRAVAPDYVVTFRRDYFNYEEWLENATWPFFEDVLLNYDIRAVTREFVLWRRRAGPWRTPNLAEAVARSPESPNGFTVAPFPGMPAETPLVVEVEYAIDNPLGWLPVAGQLPRYLLGPIDCRNQTPIALPPYRTTWSFPVFPSPGKTPSIYAGTFSLMGNGRVTLTKVTVRPIRAEGRERALFDPAALHP